MEAFAFSSSDLLISLAVKPELEPELESVRSSLGQMLEGVAGRFTAIAFNGAQILIVLVTVFFGMIYTLMNPRPIFAAMFSLGPDLVTTIKP